MSHDGAAERTPEALDSIVRTNSRAAHQAEARMMVEPSREVPVAEAHWGMCTHKMTMVLEISSPKEGALVEQQCKTQPFRHECCMPSRLESEVLGLV